MNKKFIKLLLGFIFLILLTSCENLNKQSSKEYTIKYYINDKLVEHTPNSYFENEGVTLIDYELEGYIFLGWYSTPYFDDEKLEEIDSTVKGNLILYGKVEKDEDVASSLKVTPSNIEVDYGTEIDDVISQIKVDFIYNDSSFTLSKADYSITHQYNENIPGEYAIIIKYYDLVTTLNVIVKDPVESLEVSDTHISVDYGTLLNDIFEELEVTYIIGNKSPIILSVDELSINTLYDSQIPGEYIIEIVYKHLSTNLIVIVDEQKSNEPIFAPSETETLYGVVHRENAKFNPPLESVGTQKILVIPVDFNDYPAPSNMKENLEIAFFGDGTETGWESLNSYYLKTSYNKLNIIGEVLPVYHTNKRSSYYNYSEYGDYEIIQYALDYYDDYYDYSEFDNNDDGLIDAIYLIYSRKPDYVNDNIWWAYTYEYYEEDYIKLNYDDVGPSFYVFASYEFLFEETTSEVKLKYNLETFIHETGHVLGIEDYYDYDTSYGPSGGIGGGDMMDYNIGDNNPFTKIIMGWTTPYLVTDDITINLSSFGSSGECIMIPKSFNGTYFDEYYIIDYYTPDGLNELEAGYNGLFSIDGVRIYHVNAETTGLYHTISVWDIYSYNNSDTKYRLLSLIEADGDNNISNGEYGNYSSNTDLFQGGSSYTNIKWYNGTSANFTINIVEIKNGEATIHINFK